MADILYQIRYSWNFFHSGYNDIQLKKSDVEKLINQNNWDQRRAIYELVCRSVVGRFPAESTFAYDIVSADPCDIC